MGKADVVYQSVEPAYGKNYDYGWFGFNHASNLFSKGIAHVERYERVSDIVVSHVFVVPTC